KAQLELKLGRNVEVNKKKNFKYNNGKRQCKNNIDPLQDVDGHLTNRDMDKAEVFNVFLASVFNTDAGPRGSQCPEMKNHDYENYQLPVDPELMQNLLLQLNPYKSMGPVWIHLRILSELADVIVKSVSMPFEPCWASGEVPADWKLDNVVPVFKKGKKEDPGNYRSVSLTSVSGKIMEKIILGGIEKHLKDNPVIGHSQHGFLRGKFCLSNLISFYDKVTHLADQRKPVDVIFLDFSKAFNTVSHRSFW
ncbi:RTXE polymerase, partial [Setophaga kirtlandii]|nr:RTXE polymerase [Setophaga kirtlandii]